MEHCALEDVTAYIRREEMRSFLIEAENIIIRCIGEIFCVSKSDIVIARDEVRPCELSKVSGCLNTNACHT